MDTANLVTILSSEKLIVLLCSEASFPAGKQHVELHIQENAESRLNCNLYYPNAGG